MRPGFDRRAVPPSRKSTQSGLGPTEARNCGLSTFAEYLEPLAIPTKPFFALATHRSQALFIDVLQRLVSMIPFWPASPVNFRVALRRSYLLPRRPGCKRP